MDTSDSTSTGGLRPTGQPASLLDLGTGKSNGLVIVGTGPESPGSSYDVGGELAFLKKAADLQLYASVVPAMMATFDFVLDAPIVVPVVAQYFDKVAAAVMRSISQDLGIEVKTAKVDLEGLRLSMRLRCIQLQADLLKHRFPDATVTLVMHEEPAADAQSTGEDDQTAE